MPRRISVLLLSLAGVAVAVGPLTLRAQETTTRASISHPVPAAQPDNASQIESRPVVIVQEFSVSQKTGWPYDVKQLQSETVAELRAKSPDKFDVLVGTPETARIHTYTLDGEIL